MADQTSNGTRVALYLRVSTDGQDGEDAYGLDVQRAECEAYAERHGLTIVSVHSEVVSGTNGLSDRVALPDAVAQVDAGKADGLLASSLTRIARALTTQEAILAAVWSMGGVVHTAERGLEPPDDPTDPVRTALRLMHGVFAQLDRQTIVKRLADGRAAKRHTGGYAGGYRAQTAPDLDALTLTLRRQGRSLRAIAADLEQTGHTPPGGGPWRHSTVQRMLRRAERAERGRAAQRAG